MSYEPKSVVNITAAMDETSMRGVMIRVGVICAAVALLDGSDTTSIGVAAPLIANKLKLSQVYLGPIFSSATFGMMVGALGFGALADRFGRKRILIVATLLFSVFTAATALANTLGILLLIRFSAGLGLGGAAPCFIALASEYAPKSHRAMIISFIWTAFPLGVVAGAVLNAYLLSHYSWHLIFLIGGALPFIVCLIVVRWLPESVRFLLLRRPGTVQTQRVLSLVFPLLRHDVKVVADEENTAAEASVGSLFARGKTFETLPVWTAFFAAFGMTAATFYWSPVLMHDHGITLPVASLIVGVGGGLGSLAGAAVAGWLMEKLGAVRVLAAVFLLAAMTTAVLGYAASSTTLVLLVVIANGILIAGLSTSGMLALSANIYPVAMRSTGVGWALGLGRLGEVVLPLLVAVLLSIAGGLDGHLFLIISLIPVLGAISILFLGRHRRRSGVSHKCSLTHQSVI